MAAHRANAFQIKVFQTLTDKPNAVRFDLRNGDAYDISVCMSDDLNLGDPPVGMPTPFYLENFSNGRWHIVLGSDIAFHFSTLILKGDTVPFEFHKPAPGVYRVVLEYTKRRSVPTCKEFYGTHRTKVRSAPFTVK